MRPPWTASATLPGGEKRQSAAELCQILRSRHPWLKPELAMRWAASYGNRVWDLLGARGSEAELGEHFGGQLHACEVDYLCRQEWAISAEDILWRRSKLGLLLEREQVAGLERYLSSQPRPRQQASH